MPPKRGGRLELELPVLGASCTSKQDRLLLLRPVVTNLAEALRAKRGEEQGDRQGGADWVEGVAERIAEATGGYVAADLAALNRLVMLTLLRSPSSTPLDAPALLGAYLACMQSVTPSALRGATLSLPTALSLDDVIGHEQVKRSLLRLLSFYNPRKKHLIKR